MAISRQAFLKEVAQYHKTLERMEKRALKGEKVRLLSCEEFMEQVKIYFDFEWPTVNQVLFDVHGRCHTMYFLDQNMDELLTMNHDWSFEDCRQLVEEVLIIIQRETNMQVTKCYLIRQDGSKLGVTLAWLRDRIFVQCGGINHPFDIVATTLHELGHQMVWRTPHALACVGTDKSHCLVWQRCTEVLMELFTNAPKSSHFLALLTEEYGAGWERSLVQTKAHRCRPTCRPSVAARLMRGRLDDDNAEVKCEEIYTDQQLDAMAELKKKDVLKILNKKIEDENEDIVMVSDDEDNNEDGWQTCLPEEDEEIDIMLDDFVLMGEDGWQTCLPELMESEPEYWL